MHEVFPLNDAAWSEWQDYRKHEIRKRIGPRAEKKQMRLLMAHPEPVQQQIVDQSIMNSWQGLFPPKREPQRSRDTSITDDLFDTSWAQ